MALKNIALVVFVLIATQFSLFFVAFYSIDEPESLIPKITRFISKTPRDSDVLHYLSDYTVDSWDERDFLIVFGMPSMDVPLRRWRRRMQRVTCWQFPEVATRDNNFTGAMLVLYLLARHPNNNFVLSSQVMQEAQQWQDILIHPLNEGRSDTQKHIHGQGFWGIEAEIGSSRKTFFWYDFALRQFPRAPYIARGDDDMFLRVPQYLADLRRLPLERTYWGGYLSTKQRWISGTAQAEVPFITGYCATLARDVVGAFVSYKPLRQLVWTPYTRAKEYEFLLLYMDHEDVMVARVLELLNYSVIFVTEGFERFHRYSNDPPTKNVLVTHVPKEHEYYSLFSQFLQNPTTSSPTVITKKNETFYVVTPPV